MKHTKTNKESRSLGVTIIAGCLAIGLTILALATYGNNLTGLLVSGACAFFALLALGAAAYGRKQPLKDLLELLFIYT